MPTTITLRPATDDDEEVLFTLYAQSRSEEVSAFGWDEQQQQAFLRMQFNARQMAYKMQFPGADHSVVLFGGMPAGRMIVRRLPEEIVLVDIVVSSEYRRNGIAGYVLQQLKDESAAAAIPVVLRVDQNNTGAKRFYENLGFTTTAETDLLMEMRWHAQ